MKSKWYKNWLATQYSNYEELINWSLNAPYWQHDFSGGVSIKIKSWIQPTIEDFTNMRLDIASRIKNIF